MKTKIVLGLIFYGIFLSRFFMSELIGQELYRVDEPVGKSEVVDFTKIKICGYQLGTVMNDQLLEGMEKDDIGQEFHFFSTHGEWNDDRFKEARYDPVTIYKKDLKIESGPVYRSLKLFYKVKLFLAPKNRKLIAISVMSEGFRTDDVLPTVKNIFSKKYKINTWNNKKNKYFDFLKNEETGFIEPGSEVLSGGGWRERDFYFDGKTLLYLMADHLRSGSCIVYAFFIDVNGLEFAIKCFDEEVKRQKEVTKQKKLKRQREEEQERNRTISEAETRL